LPEADTDARKKGQSTFNVIRDRGVSANAVIAIHASLASAPLATVSSSGNSYLLKALSSWLSDHV
jgi:hypothetical protein